MKDFWLNLVSTVAAAGLIANVGMLWHFSERLTRLEVEIRMMTPNHVAHNTK